MIRLLIVAALALSPPSFWSSDCDAERVRALTQRAQFIVVAKVIEVEPALGLWSGYFHVVQHVTYEVEEALKGKLPQDKIVVAHSVVKNAVTADTEEARLSPKLFEKGKSFVLFLESTDGKNYISRGHPPKAYFSLNDYCLPTADAATIRLIKEYVATPSRISDCDEQLSKALTERAEIVVVAKVIEVEPPLGLWSGYHAIGQHVKYEVEEVIKGKLIEREVYVAHGIVKNAPTVDKEQARLSPKLFVKGNRFLLFLVNERGNGYLTRTHPVKAYLSLNEKCLPMADTNTIKLIRQYAATPELNRHTTLSR